jgi:asparaginyl-tRNA synthetase
LLEKDISEGKVKFENEIKWGVDLSSEHEKYITEIAMGPVHVFNYPKKIKSFYMKDNCEED